MLRHAHDKTQFIKINPIQLPGEFRLNPLFPKSLFNRLEAALLIFLLLSVSGLHEMPRWLSIVMSGAYTAFPLFIVALHWKRLAYIATKDIWLSCLILMPIASLLWSANPGTTAFDLRFLIRATLVGIYIAIRYSPKEIIRLLLWTTGIAMLLSVGFGLLFPANSIQKNGTAWIGVFGHKQGVGSFMGFTATLFTAYLFTERSRRWLGAIGLGLAIALVLLSQSKTGLVLCLLPLLFMPLYKISKQGKHRGMLLILALFTTCFIAALAIINLETIVVSWLGKDLEFNGRVPIWLLTLSKGWERSWLGYGYHGFWTSDISDVVLFNTWASLEQGFKTRTVIPNAHQGFIDLFIQFGLIGFTLFLTNLVLLIKRVIDLLLSTRSMQYFWMLMFLNYFVVINLFESVIILEQGIAWIIYVSVSYRSALEYSLLKKARHTLLARPQISNAST
jgi:exopolysaccharide production protein ExoQ